MLSKRIQVLLAPEDIIKLKKASEEEGKSVGLVIREAIHSFFFKQAARRRKANVLKELGKLMRMNLPVSDPAEMKREAMEGKLKNG